MSKVKSQPKAKKAAAQETSPALPLFFRQPVALDPARHAQAGVTADEGFAFAQDTNSVALVTAEFAEAARHYPIVFTQSDNPVPVAILGLEQRNYFVDERGEWEAGSYIPAYVRKYPFVFMEAPERNQLLLCIDEGAPHFHARGGREVMPLYKGKELSDVTRNALEFCASFHNHYVFTRRFMEKLKALGLLAPMRSNAKLANGRQVSLSGFQVIDEAKFKALPADALHDLHKSDMLSLVYLALWSSANWNRLAERAGRFEKTN